MYFFAGQPQLYRSDVLMGSVGRELEVQFTL
jgi:hypothetical protein